MALLELQEVYKIYHMGDAEVRALDGVTLRIEEGEFLSVVGQSGSGKSTLMHILGCLDLPTRGSYRLNGQDIRSYSEDRMAVVRNRTIGFVFQGFHLLPTLTAQENVELPLLYRGVGAARRARLACEALEQVGLSGRAAHRPNQLSGGQQQRVAIARAMVTDPAILLADEPTGNLDASCGREVLATLCMLHRSGKTLVLITHDDSVAAAAERRIRIAEGRVV